MNVSAMLGGDVNNFELRFAQVEKLRNAVRSGAIETASRATLTEYSTWLCEPQARGSFSGDSEYEQICELVRLHMLRTIIDSFEERSKITQRWVLFFAVLAVAATLMPYAIPVPSNPQTKQESKESVAASGPSHAQPAPAKLPSQRPPSIQNTEKKP